MTITESREIYELPEYLGFGVLSHNSIVRTERGVSAKYCLDDEVVYAVEWTQDGCKLEEFYEGDTISSSYGERLSMALFHLLQSSNPIEHPRFLQLGNDVIHTGNIHFIWPNMEGFLYYPAGFLFDLRQPVVNCNRKAWAKLESNMTRNDKEFPFNLHAEYHGAIFRLMQDGTVNREDIKLVHLICTLLNLAKTTEFCQQNGLIPTEKEYRMTITSGGQGLDSMNLFAGDLQRSIQTFAVFEFGIETSQIPAERATELFASLCSVPLKLDTSFEPSDN